MMILSDMALQSNNSTVTAADERVTSNPESDVADEGKKNGPMFDEGTTYIPCSVTYTEQAWHRKSSI